MKQYIVALVLALASAVNAWRYPFYYPSSRQHDFAQLPYYNQHFPTPWPYYPAVHPAFRAFPYSPRPLYPHRFYADSLVDREFEPEKKMEFRDDIESDDELYDPIDDEPVPDSRILLFQTNTPYRRFNNFIRALDNWRTAMKSRRRWNFKIRRNKNGFVIETYQTPTEDEKKTMNAINAHNAINAKPPNYANNGYFYDY